MKEHKQGTVLGGALLVAGTTIGGGMLALPVLTSPGGFIPSLCLYAACWLFMTLTGLLFLELSLQMEDGVNIVSMAERTLGKGGKAVAWVLYLFLFYCLTIAYIEGCGDILSTISQGMIPRTIAPLVFLCIFAPFVYLGTRVVSRLNFYFMAALGILYLALVFLGLPEVQIKNLNLRNWNLSLLALPIAFIAFAYQGIIPTLTSYLHHDRKKLTTSIWLGTLTALAIYVIWQWIILGIIPFAGPGGLEEALKEGQSAIYPLRKHLNLPHIYLLGQGFAFFALLTSYFGVSLGLNDFLADGLKIKKTSLQGRLGLLALITIPPLTIALIYPDIFLKALDIAGGYGSALLLGLLPILMVAKWRAQHPESPRLVKGGMLTLGLMALFVLFEISIELYKLI